MRFVQSQLKIRRAAALVECRGASRAAGGVARARERVGSLCLLALRALSLPSTTRPLQQRAARATIPSNFFFPFRVSLRLFLFHVAADGFAERAARAPPHPVNLKRVSHNFCHVFRIYTRPFHPRPLYTAHTHTHTYLCRGVPLYTLQYIYTHPQTAAYICIQNTTLAELLFLSRPATHCFIHICIYIYIFIHPLSLRSIYYNLYIYIYPSPLPAAAQHY